MVTQLAVITQTYVGAGGASARPTTGLERFALPVTTTIAEALQVAASEEEVAGRVELRPRIRVGKPCIRGTRVPLYALLYSLAEGLTLAEVAEQYPGIEPADVEAALLFAGRLCEYGLEE